MNHKKLKDNHLLLLYVIGAACFLYLVVLNQGTYGAWILDGIIVPTGIFIFFFLIVATFVRENKKLVILAALFLVVMNLIPGLKYPFFQGVFDTPGHYRFTNQIVTLGHVPEGEFYSESYGDNPGMHILMGCFSIISGISVNEVFKFVIPMLWSLVPLITYFITKNVVDETVQRYTIIASSFLVIRGYLIVGTNLALIPYYLLIGVFLRYVFAQSKKRAFLIFSIVSFTLVISHGVTPFFVSLLLIGILPILSFFSKIRRKSVGSFPVSALVMPCLFYVTLLWTWWMNTTGFNLDMFAGLINRLLNSATPVVPTRFYEIPLLPQLQVLIVSYLANAIMGILSLFGLLIFLRKIRRNELSRKTETFYIYIIALLGVIAVFLFVQFVSNFGMIQYSRFIAYAMPICAFMGGWTLWRFEKFLNGISAKPRIRNLAFASFLFLLISSCLIQFFPYQPLVPRANVLSTNLPENEYIVDLLLVNTVYQKEMISFAEKYSKNGRIASDEVTRTQMFGFSEPSFFSRHIWYKILIPAPDQNIEWDLFLLHTSKAGPFGEKVEYRTKERIENIRLTAGNIIYDNGESFIISHFYDYDLR